MSQVNLLPPDILQGQRYRRLTLTVLAAGAIVLTLIVVFFFIQVGRLGAVNDDIAAKEQTNAELKAVTRALAQTYPENIDSTAFAVPLQRDLTRNARTSFLLLLAAAGLVLLIACANVAGLLVTRGAERDREFAVRTALGGSRIQLLRQLLVEGLLLSASGAVIGVLL